jgi:hypothetical protein
VLSPWYALLLLVALSFWAPRRGLTEKERKKKHRIVYRDSTERYSPKRAGKGARMTDMVGLTDFGVLNRASSRCASLSRITADITCHQDGCLEPCHGQSSELSPQAKIKGQHTLVPLLFTVIWTQGLL